MIIKNTKSFMDFCNQVGIHDLINKSPTTKFKKTIIRNNDKNLGVEKHEIEKNTVQPEKKEKLETLKKRINQQTVSIKETATNFVFSDGNINSDIMIIGDAPGSEEDRSGIPFSGEDGKLLILMLSYIGLNKNNCYFSNLVFWRPPGNRVPNKEEIKICLPFTREHIEIIKPKLLVLVGGITANSILNCSESITKLRGKEFSYQTKEKKIKAHIIYHPSFLINSPIEKKRAWFDLTEISKILENEKY